MNKSTRKGAVVEISSLRDLEKLFASISKIFVDKESENNWEERSRIIVQLRRVLASEWVNEWKDTLIKGIHNTVSSFIKSIHSLRTSVAMDALSLIADIGSSIGDSLDIYTVEIIIHNLLKSSSITKKLIITKTMEVTNMFLTCISFHFKIVHILCKTMEDKNVQLRQATASYLKTMLEIHGSKESVRSIMEKAENSHVIEHFLKRGFVDAAPTVRESCRTVYWAYQHYWPLQAERLLHTLDPTTTRQLEKSNPKGTKSSALQPLSRNNSLSSLSSKGSASSSFRKPTLTKPLQHGNKLRKITTASSIPATSEETRRKISRLSHLSHVSAPASTPRTVLTSSIPTRRTKSDFHQQSAITSFSVLHMLRANDSHLVCKALRLLADKLKNTIYHPSGNTVLPPDVPSRLNLMPVLMDHLSSTQLDVSVYEMLMSWDCMAGIFVNVMALNYYCPTLIIADQQCVSGHRSKKEMEIMHLFSRGLLRLKMFLKRNDPELASRLLTILRATHDIQNSTLFDSSIKRDIQLYPTYKHSLQVGLLHWMDELVSDYAGLKEDEDRELLMEGSRWLNKNSEVSASQWFDSNDHLRFYADSILAYLDDVTLDHPTMAALSCLLARLKMANERVFENSLCAASESVRNKVDEALDIRPHEESTEEDIIAKSTSSLSLEDVPLIQESEMEYGLLQELDEDDNNDTGMTQDISNIDLGDKPEEETRIATTLSTVVSITPPAMPISRKRSNAPTPDSKENDDGHSVKRRKEGMDHLQPREDKLREMILLIKTNKADKSVFLRLQKLSVDTTIPTIHHRKDNIWAAKDLFVSLLAALTHYLNSHYGTEEQRAHAIVLIRRLITHQSELFKQLEKTVSFDEVDSVICQLVKALISCNIDIYSNISTPSSEVIEALFSLFTPETTLKILWGLSSYYERTPIEDKVHVSVCNPLSTLFLHIGNVAPKSSRLVLEQLLQNGAADILVKGYGHSDVSVRRSCVRASMGIYKVLGDPYIKTYLSLLSADQLNLLQHYINKSERIR